MAGFMMSIQTIQQPLSGALLQQADQMREILELARQKVDFATSQNAIGNGVPMFDTMTEALPAIGIAALVAAAAAAAVGGYFLYRWMKHRRAVDLTASTT